MNNEGPACRRRGLVRLPDLSNRGEGEAAVGWAARVFAASADHDLDPTWRCCSDGDEQAAT